MNKIFTLLLFVLISIVAKGQTVDFTYINSNGTNGYCSPAIINFTPITTGSLVGLTWYFGNGETSNSAIPSIVYNTGTYQVKLVAVFQNVALEVIKTIVVNPSITASLVGSAAFLCKPDTVRFTCNTNATGATYIYNFNDGTPSVTSSSNSITHSYTSFGIYAASVQVTSADGCVATSIFNVEVKRVLINAAPLPDEGGCVPITRNFSATVITPPGDAVASYTWGYGVAGLPPNVTTANNSFYTYTDSGTYTPTLLVTTTNGCTNTYTYPSISFGKPPTLITASANKPVYCVKETGNFIATSNFANAYKWEFGDGVIITIPDTFTTYQYFTVGPKIVKVTPIFNGCPGTPISFVINVVGVLANFTYLNTCSDKKTFRFTNFSTGNITSNTWSFGDGSPNTTQINPTHTYPPVGTFNTQLLVVDAVSGCRDSLQIPIYTANPSLANPANFVCRKDSTTFTILNNYANPGLVATYTTLGTTSPPVTFANSLTVVANTFGNFNTHRVVLDNGGSYCKDTLPLNKLISVRGPILNFSTNAFACTNNKFTITNNSTPFAATDIINDWKWTFDIPGIIDIQQQPTPFIFPGEGTYNITLVAKDINGCKDTLVSPILVKESPFLRIFPREKTICAGTPVTLTAYYTDVLQWMPTNLVACAVCDTTIASVNTTSKIFAMASNAQGCSLLDSTLITVAEPFSARAIPTNTFFACKGDTVSIRGILPADKRILWSPTTGLNNPNSYTPFTTVTRDTTSYTALLTDSLNCFSSSITVKVQEHPPALVNAGPNRILAYNSPFTIRPTYSPDIISYNWQPAGNLTCTNCPNPTGIADALQTFIIAVRNANCAAKDTITVAVECAFANIYMASAFNPTSTGIKKYYYPQTRGIKKINKFTIYNRYGQIVYNVQNAAPNVRALGWEGRYNLVNQNSEGFVYTLEATCELGEILTTKGTFLLVR